MGRNLSIAAPVVAPEEDLEERLRSDQGGALLVFTCTPGPAAASRRR
jgi:hypothetical protein